MGNETTNTTENKYKNSVKASAFTHKKERYTTLFAWSFKYKYWFQSRNGTLNRVFGWGVKGPRF